MSNEINNKATNNDFPVSFEELFKEIGKILDRKLSASNNPVIQEYAGMDALMNVRNSLCKNVIKSFTPTFGIDEEKKEVK